MNGIYLKIIICAAMGYLIGSFNLAYILAKLKGYDIRMHGSGNAGASNTVILMGKKAGFIVALVDIFKSYLAIRLAMYLCPDSKLSLFITATSVILGNIFPFYMNFKGGKGFAALAGTVLGCNYKLFFILLIIVAVLVFITDYVCVGPMFASLAFPVCSIIEQRETYPVIFFLATGAILYRHMENIKRIKNGSELRFSFLWNRKREAERFGIIDDDGENYPFDKKPGPAEKENKLF
ncbi:MAG: glycerol-3-phosphate acyltransferase [Lachnospiraceae bacterium]|nr:glycerol-3-phosphate acyltransferase [Lachnospiraceae bacterium]